MPRRGAAPITYRTFPDVLDETHGSEPLSPVLKNPDSQLDSIEFRRTPYQWKTIQTSPMANAVAGMTHANAVSGGISNMTLPPHGPGRRSGMDQVAWFSSVKVRRDKGSIGLIGGDLSNAASPSRTRGTPSSGARSLSHSRDPVEHPDLPQDVPDEISLVMKKLNGKVQHEKTETSKKNTKCTFTLYGPWSEEGSATFMRVTFFNFPKEYPRSTSPISKPSVEIEKGVDIPMKTRAILLRNLRRILGTKAPALELCLLFLLGLYKKPTLPDSNSDDEVVVPHLARQDFIAPILLDYQSLPKTRHTFASFGIDGQLVTFFRIQRKQAPPGDSPTRTMNRSSHEFHRATSGTLLDAMWGLSRLATDAPFIPRDYVDTKRKRRTNFTENLIIRPSMRSRTRDPNSSPSYVEGQVSIKRFPKLDNLDRSLGSHGRPDLARSWALLRDSLVHALPGSPKTGSDGKAGIVKPFLGRDFTFVYNIMVEHFRSECNIQMLAMLAVLMLKVDAVVPQVPSPSVPQPTTNSISAVPAIDYFSLVVPSSTIHTPVTVMTAKPPTRTEVSSRPVPIAAPSPASISSGVPSLSLSSSKVSWSSILSYRNLLGGSSDSASPASRREKSVSGASVASRAELSNAAAAPLESYEGSTPVAHRGTARGTCRSPNTLRQNPQPSNNP
ncbi:uncharacterized protein EI90DRAFT_1876089 [Cantharellus anzutake]|uniref:uncharacterized protein n=1 Tax=Cantharellus anzutake TaxID=1750568 RepID=UPI0019079F47|nr:uncharacterized protein EI90DRAFT_1876089 [Cantharellus anzutake]KAF8326824.1 hypothetical protein EI90DRAFT_1876089 [Cantharellus anzutake]